LIVGGRFPDLLQGCSFINTIHCYDQLRFIRFPWLFFRFLYRIRSIHYEVVLDAKRVFSVNNFLLTVFSGAAFRIGFLHSDTPGKYNFEIPLNEEPFYEPVFLARLFSAFQPDYSVPALHLPLTAEMINQADIYLKRLDLPVPHRLIAVHPGGRGNKRWPPESFAQVCTGLLSEPDIIVFVFLGPDEATLETCFPEHIRLRIIRPRTPSVMAALFKSCRLLICNDTGPLHVAAAVGVPTVSIFLSTSPLRLAPQGPQHKVLDGTHGQYMTPDQVVQAVKQSAGKEAV